MQATRRGTAVLDFISISTEQTDQHQLQLSYWLYVAILYLRAMNSHLKGSRPPIILTAPIYDEALEKR